jgi:hypothetical protein
MCVCVCLFVFLSVCVFVFCVCVCVVCACVGVCVCVCVCVVDTLQKIQKGTGRDRQPYYIVRVLPFVCKGCGKAIVNERVIVL